MKNQGRDNQSHQNPPKRKPSNPKSPANHRGSIKASLAMDSVQEGSNEGGFKISRRTSMSPQAPGSSAMLSHDVSQRSVAGGPNSQHGGRKSEDDKKISLEESSIMNSFDEGRSQMERKMTKLLESKAAAKRKQTTVASKDHMMKDKGKGHESEKKAGSIAKDASHHKTRLRSFTTETNAKKGKSGDVAVSSTAPHGKGKAAEETTDPGKSKQSSKHGTFKDHPFPGINNHETPVHNQHSGAHANTSHHHPRVKSNRKAKILTRSDEEKMLQKSTIYRQIMYLEKNTHFDADEIRGLQEMFKVYSSSTKKGTLDRLLFRDILIKTFGILDDEMLNRLYLFFDSDQQGNITDTEWIQNLSIFLRGTLDQHIDFVYDIYDINGDRGISREELTTLLRDCLFNLPGNDDDGNDGLKEIVEIAIKNLDVEKTGIITPENFRTAVHRDPLLLQCLGPCLPSEKNLKAFMTLITDNYQNYSTNYSNPRDPGYTFKTKEFTQLM